MDLSPLLILGVVLGARHALDADHLVAVSTILSRERSVRNAVSVGVLWGIGHSVTILLVGGLIIALQWSVPPRIEILLEIPVALMLVILGVRSIRTTLPPREHDHQTTRSAHVHDHVHVHGDYIHTHGHGHDAETHGHAEEDTPLAKLDRSLSSIGIYHAARPVIVGIIHGLAGSAAVALLVLPLVGSVSAAILYLVLFGVGTIAGMTAVTASLSVPLATGARRWAGGQKLLIRGVGLVSIGFGIVLGGQLLTAL